MLLIILFCIVFILFMAAFLNQRKISSEIKKIKNEYNELVVVLKRLDIVLTHEKQKNKPPAKELNTHPLKIKRNIHNRS